MVGILRGVVATAPSNTIGVFYGGKTHMPWPRKAQRADLRSFYRHTIGHPIIVGWNTYFEYVSYSGHGLPKRRNVVITRNLKHRRFVEEHGGLPVRSYDEALAAVNDEALASVIGGSTIYEIALAHEHKLDELYRTRVCAPLSHLPTSGRIFFPKLGYEWIPAPDSESGYSVKEGDRYPSMVQHLLYRSSPLAHIK